VSWHPQGRVVEVLGRRVHYVDVGRGPTVLLLHGFLHSSRSWARNLDALSAHYRVLAPDQIGTGESQRGPWDYSLDGLMRFTEALLDTLGVETLHAAVGNSLGGGTLARLALHAPTRVRRLVLVDSVGLRARFPWPLKLIGHPATEPLVRLLAGSRAVGRLVLGRLAFPTTPVDDEILDGFRAGFSWPGTFHAAAEIARVHPATTAALHRHLHEIEPPTLVVWGRHDRLIPLRAGRRLASTVPRARLHVFEDCGHCPQLEAPERFNRLLLEFFGEDGPPLVRPNDTAA